MEVPSFYTESTQMFLHAVKLRGLRLPNEIWMMILPDLIMTKSQILAQRSQWRIAAIPRTTVLNPVVTGPSLADRINRKRAGGVPSG